jgi:outer membrane protein TolC
LRWLLAGGLLVTLVHGRESTPPLPRPLTLDAALAYASANNRGLLSTREQIREQEGVLIEVRADRLPSLDATGKYSRTDEELLAPGYRDDSWSAAVTVQQVIYAGGGVQARVRGQREQVEAAKLAFTATLNDTLLAVRKQFYDVLLARELIGVREEALRVLESELTNAQHRRAAGSGSDFDVLRAEVAAANARPALIRARNTYRTSQDRLRASLGAADNTSLQPTDLDVQGSLELPVRDIALADVIPAARANRPELLRQERLVQAAEQGITAARSGYLPSVSAYASYQWTQPTLVAATQDYLDGWTAGLQANWSIFDGRATAGRVTQARSRVNQARYGAEELQLTVDVEARQAHSALTEASELLVSSNKVVEQARESLRLSQARFQAGTATQLDVLTAQSQLTLARSNLAEAQHGYAVALASLNRAIGLTTAAGSDSRSS